MNVRFPAEQIRWRDVTSSNVSRVGWDRDGNMYVVFQPASLYVYRGVSRQRAVAMTRAKSVGSYLNKKIKPHFAAVRLV